MHEHTPHLDHETENHTLYYSCTHCPAKRMTTPRNVDTQWKIKISDAPGDAKNNWRLAPTCERTT